MFTGLSSPCYIGAEMTLAHDTHCPVQDTSVLYRLRCQRQRQRQSDPGDLEGDLDQTRPVSERLQSCGPNS